MKQLFQDTSGTAIPAEMFMFLGIILCVVTIGWAISSDSMDINVIGEEQTTKQVKTTAQTDMAVNNAANQLSRTRQTSTTTPSPAPTPDPIINQVNICGREEVE